MIQIITLPVYNGPRQCDHHHRRHGDAATPTDVTADDDDIFLWNFNLMHTELREYLIIHAQQGGAG